MNRIVGGLVTLAFELFDEASAAPAADWFCVLFSAGTSGRATIRKAAVTRPGDERTSVMAAAVSLETTAVAEASGVLEFPTSRVDAFIDWTVSDALFDELVPNAPLPNTLTYPE
jgi:hypothetical protein